MVAINQVYWLKTVRRKKEKFFLTEEGDQEEAYYTNLRNFNQRGRRGGYRGKGGRGRNGRGNGDQRRLAGGNSNQQQQQQKSTTSTSA